jgi:hypothetical protein
MNHDQLIHAIRAACTISQDNELYVFGSQSILGQFPEADERLRRSIEVDLCPVNKPESVNKIDGALGEMSQFHQTHGFYVHGVSIESATLPEGWKDRTIVVADYNDTHKKGYCIEAHDLAASKLIAFRTKDIEFVRVLILEKLIEPGILIGRLEITPANKDLLTRAVHWVQKLIFESNSD